MTELVPILFALIAALLFAVNFYVQRTGLKALNPITGAFISVATMAGMFWALSPFFLDPRWLLDPTIFYFLAAGLTFPAMGQFLQIKSVSVVGPAVTSAAGSLMPLFAALPAVIFLDESFGWQIASGFALMIFGVALTSLIGGKLSRSWPLWALLIPIGASASRGLVHPLTKTGMEIIQSPLFATMIMGSMSTLVLLAITLGSGKGATLKALPKGAWWFVLTGVINGTGILFVNMAVSMGDITRVSPFVSTTPIWVLLMGWAFFRVEKLGLIHLMAVILVVAGSALIVTR
jgi:DME family drug/metabolite transporter